MYCTLYFNGINFSLSLFTSFLNILITMTNKVIIFLNILFVYKNGVISLWGGDSGENGTMSQKIKCCWFEMVDKAVLMHWYCLFHTLLVLGNIIRQSQGNSYWYRLCHSHYFWKCYWVLMKVRVGENKY